jgi:hypothetical protein
MWNLLVNFLDETSINANFLDETSINANFLFLFNKKNNRMYIILHYTMAHQGPIVEINIVLKRGKPQFSVDHYS